MICANENACTIIMFFFPVSTTLPQLSLQQHTTPAMEHGPLLAVRTIQLHKTYLIFTGNPCTLPREHREISSVAVSNDVLLTPWRRWKSHCTSVQVRIYQSILKVFHPWNACAHRFPHGSMKRQTAVDEVQNFPHNVFMLS